MKILLAYQSGLSNRNDPYISLVPTGLCYLHASLLEAGYDSLLANFSAWPVSKIKRELLVFKPDVIGISQWTHNRHISMEFARLCRAVLPNSTIVMGGAHATFCFEDILGEGSAVNIVVRGEGELTLLELSACLESAMEWRHIAGLAFYQNGKVEVTQPHEHISDLDRLPMPARYLERSIGLDTDLQSEFVVTTRGCPSACYFCSSPDFWGRKVRFRSPAAILEEILYIREKYGLIYFSIRDDTFTADRNRVLEFCRLLQKNKVNILWNCQSRVSAIDKELITEMKRSGCECIQLGVESGSAGTLRQLGKTISVAQIERACELISDIGINLSIYLISDVPGESDDDIRQTVELVRRIRPDDGYVSPLAYYPGTQLYREAVASGRVTTEIFSKSAKKALYVSTAIGNSAACLLDELSSNRQDDSKRFKVQKKLLGYCFTTNVIAGEWYRQKGEYTGAEKEFSEITRREPDNPWGWFLLGDLYCEVGNTKKAKESYAKVLAIVPNHGPSREILKQL